MAAVTLSPRIATVAVRSLGHAVDYGFSLVFLPSSRAYRVERAVERLQSRINPCWLLLHALSPYCPHSRGGVQTDESADLTISPSDATADFSPRFLHKSARPTRWSFGPTREDEPNYRLAEPCIVCLPACLPACSPTIQQRRRERSTSSGGTSTTSPHHQVEASTSILAVHQRQE
ncbi:hypothetical protein ANO11243_078670 [Dothideomycetidae sp. 11243]|nr:hypothetical protein ANO11243_078670 [fungal sp. No.11243]